MLSKNTICLWFNDSALEAAQFYAATFPDSAMGAVHLAPVLTAGIADPDAAVAKRVFEAMMTMRKIDVAAIEAARRG
jgi:predicted 3-demethylubiquinone-9 3-methyltransferase (glyoxalase superfamily)